MNYAETLELLYNRLPLFSRVGPAAYKKDLHNTRALCTYLGDPQQRFPSIHVAGTNGKGSVSHGLASVLQSAGYKTGLYTSPHLYDFRERIRIDGAMIPEEEVVRFVEKALPWIDELQPSFFELTVAMAFDYFARAGVDVAVIETGLGGRLDSTNIITPVLSVITNIGWDHMNLLGNSLEAIAGEKAGIIKPGIPAVIGETLPETKTVFEQTAREKGASLYLAEEKYEIGKTGTGGHLHWYQYRGTDNTMHILPSDLKGTYQEKNIRTMLTALDVLQEKGWNIRPEALRRGLIRVKGNTGLMGRWDVLRERPVLVLDVAHNREGIAQLVEQLSKLSFRQLHLVFGTVKDKDPLPVLELLPREGRYYFTEAQIPRALSAATLQEQATAAGLTGTVHPQVNEAVAAAFDAAGPEDLVIVCGSIFVVAEVDRQRWAAVNS
ncbi:MAG TPA: folylpolyglutamate synthase/dihydrofolate synthase family protein [Chitinophagaceae bacterium]|jgi:dihydrofolate synthase/folylpolyglutamate synthase|nr:folylpolyglutamate synthase/dihydrofolate synthase family protein [Chitinophagaceae bacterium]